MPSHGGSNLTQSLRRWTGRPSHGGSNLTQSYHPPREFDGWRITSLLPAELRQNMALYRSALSTGSRHFDLDGHFPKRHCIGAAGDEYDELWKPASRYDLRNVRALNNMSVLLAGDSSLAMLSAAMKVVVAATGSNLKITHRVVELLPEVGNEVQTAKLLKAVAAHDVTIMNAGLHYNHKPLCNEGQDSMTEFVTTRISSVICDDAGARNSSVVLRKIRGENTPPYLRAEMQQMMSAMSQIRDHQDHVLWFETTAQHFDTDDGSFDSSILSYRNVACVPLSSNHIDWRNAITTPLAQKAGLKVISFRLTERRVRDHPNTITGQSCSANHATRGGTLTRCDCTHYCLDSATLLAAVELAFEVVGRFSLPR